MLIQSVLANFERSDNIQIVSSVIVIAMLVASLLSRKHHSNQPLLKYAFYWLLIICVGIFLYSFKDGYENIKERFMTALIPSRAVDTGGEITIKKSVNGHFLVDAFVNDKPVKFLIDTGASSVVLSLEDAKKVGVDIENLSFNRIVQTASGQGKVANFEDHYYPSGLDMAALVAEFSLNRANGMDDKENIDQFLKKCDEEYDVANVD